jgi:parallel beta helix pectate lyase-like protein
MRQRPKFRRTALIGGLAGVLIVGGAAVGYAAAAPTGNGPGGCFDPAAAPYLAVPGDGLDDTSKIQAAIDDAGVAGGTVCLGAGRWTVTRGTAPHNTHAGLSTHGAHVTIAGGGPGTVLDLRGDLGRSDLNVISLDPGATDVQVERLTIDTSAATNTDEQTHAIGVGSGFCATAGGCATGVSDVTIQDVGFRHPAAPDGSRKGDCVRLLGQSPALPVVRVTIAGSSFTDCARSGIGVQREVRSLAVLGNHFGGRIGDTPFDSEPTGGEDDGLRLVGNSFDGGTATFGVTITSYHHAVVSGNTFAGRGLFVYRSTDVLVADNSFDVTATTGNGVIETGNVADGVKIDNNMIRRHGVAGPGVRIMPHSGGLPGPVSVSGNTMVLDGDADAIVAEGARSIAVRDNDVTFTGAAPNGSGVHLQAINGPVDRATITGNTVDGAGYFAAVRLDARPQKFGDVTVALNSAGAGIGSLRCTQSGPGLFPRPVISLGNRWNVAPSCVAALDSGQ